MSIDQAGSTPNRVLKRGRKFLNTPGPTNLPESVLNAMHRPTVDLEDPTFIEAARDSYEKLQRIIGTRHDVVMYISNGHGAWEAALVNTLAPGDKVIAPETGHFSTSWLDMAQALELEVEHLPGDWRRALRPETVAERLAADKDGEIKAVLMVHTETGTGITADVQAVRKAIDDAGHNALLMVDTVASLGTCPYEMDAWGVDVTIAASQKGLMMAPGMGFVAVNDKAMEAYKRSTPNKRYWDIGPRLEGAGYLKFCGTSPQLMMFGLQEGLSLFFQEGPEKVFERHRVLAEATWKAIDVWAGAGALEINALDPAERSVGVTAIRVAEGIDASQIRTLCRDEMMTGIAGGLGQLKGHAFRIGHMGDMNAPMLYAALGSVEATLNYLDVPYTPGGVTAAITHIAEYKKANGPTTF